MWRARRETGVLFSGFPRFSLFDTFFLFVSVWLTTAVTFWGILRCREEGDAAAVTECIFDWRRQMKWRQHSQEDEKQWGRWDGGRMTLCLSCPIVRTAGHFGSDSLISDIFLKDSHQMREKIDWKGLIAESGKEQMASCTNNCALKCFQVTEWAVLVNTSKNSED